MDKVTRFGLKGGSQEANSVDPPLYRRSKRGYFGVKAVKFWEKVEKKEKDFFLVEWINEKEKTFVTRENFPSVGPWARLLELATRRGVWAKTIRVGGRRIKGNIPRSRCGGDIITIGTDGKRQSLIDTALLPAIRWSSESENCVLFSLLNVTGSTARKKKRLVKALDTQLCGLNELAEVSHILRVGLIPHRDKTLGWIVEKKQGRWLLMQQVHCIAIDSNKGYIFDSSRDNVLPLSLENLHLCGFTDGEIEIREVVHDNPNFR